ncbi:MAG: hypothetical protein CM15mP109_11430 [Candidatus Dadabacteria bacterium]|nr:MAG: hypothetical protein CM15mP109_11430 [Candidatus Dadabacteria bacterium]
MSEEIKKIEPPIKIWAPSTKEDWDITLGMQEISIKTFSHRILDHLRF